MTRTDVEVTRMASKVHMTHPRLPDRSLWVRPRAVAAYEQSGWQVSDPPQPESEEDSAERGQKPERRTRRRATTAASVEPPSGEA